MRLGLQWGQLCVSCLLLNVLPALLLSWARNNRYNSASSLTKYDLSKGICRSIIQWLEPLCDPLGMQNSKIKHAIIHSTVIHINCSPNKFPFNMLNPLLSIYIFLESILWFKHRYAWSAIKTIGLQRWCNMLSQVEGMGILSSDWLCLPIPYGSTMSKHRILAIVTNHLTNQPASPRVRKCLPFFGTLLILWAHSSSATVSEYIVSLVWHKLVYSSLVCALESLNSIMSLILAHLMIS